MLSILTIGAAVVLSIIAAALAYPGVCMVRHALKSGSDGDLGDLIVGVVFCLLAAGLAIGAYFAAF